MHDLYGISINRLQAPPQCKTPLTSRLTCIAVPQCLPYMELRGVFFIYLLVYVCLHVCPTWNLRVCVRACVCLAADRRGDRAQHGGSSGGFYGNGPGELLSPCCQVVAMCWLRPNPLPPLVCFRTVHTSDRSVDHDLDTLVARLLLREIVQDLQSTDRTQEACATCVQCR